MKCFYWNDLDFEHALLGCQGPRDDESLSLKEPIRITPLVPTTAFEL